jgi:outer membrane immunogenic protein
LGSPAIPLKRRCPSRTDWIISALYAAGSGSQSRRRCFSTAPAGGVNSKTDIDQALAGPGTPTVNVPYSSDSNFSSTRVGWTAGAGLAWMLSPQWSVKLEYLYYDLGSVYYGGVLNNIVSPPGGIVPTGAAFYTVGVTASTRFDGNIVRVGLNYQFD